jgi:hypothetical protein
MPPTSKIFIPDTEISILRVRLKEGLPPYRKMRRTKQQDFWLNKISDMYEHTIYANGKLSDWSTDAVVVPKPGQGPDGEMRITFDYHNVEEVKPGMVLNLTKEIHDLLKPIYSSIHAVRHQARVLEPQCSSR